MAIVPTTVHNKSHQRCNNNHNKIRNVFLIKNWYLFHLRPHICKIGYRIKVYNFWSQNHNIDIIDTFEQQIKPRNGADIYGKKRLAWSNNPANICIQQTGLRLNGGFNCFGLIGSPDCWLLARLYSIYQQIQQSQTGFEVFSLRHSVWPFQSQSI